MMLGYAPLCALVWPPDFCPTAIHYALNLGSRQHEPSLARFWKHKMKEHITQEAPVTEIFSPMES